MRIFARFAIALTIGLAVPIGLAPAGEAAVSWSQVHGAEVSGGSAKVNAFFIDSQDRLYIGGSFTSVGGVSANNIAMWDGAWHALGSGTNGDVADIVMMPSGLLAVGGSFSSPAGHVAYWNPSTSLWSGVGYFNGAVEDLEIGPDSNLYAAGPFSIFEVIQGNNLITTSTPNVARLVGSSWEALGGGPADGSVGGTAHTIAFSPSGMLYAGGIYVSDLNDNIKKWNGTTWSTVGLGLSSNVRDILVVSDTEIYAAGDFNTTADGSVPVKKVAKWNGSTWSTVGHGFPASVRTLARDVDGNLYAGGDFTQEPGNAGNVFERLAKWDGSSWTALTPGANGNVYKILAEDYGPLYIGGTFTSAGGVASSQGMVMRSDPVVRGPIAFTGGAFGTVTYGTPNAITVSVKNDSQNVLTPSQIAVSGSGVTLTGGTCAAGTSIAAQQTCTVGLTWSPTGPGTLLNAQLDVAYRGGTNASDSLLLSGVAIAAGALTFSEGDFPSTLVGEVVTLDVVATNSGTAPLTPSQILVTGARVAKSDLGTTCSTGVAVPANATCTIRLTWSPIQSGALTGALLTVAYPDGLASSDSLALSGATTVAGPLQFSSGSFGDVTLGTTSNLTLQVTNTGTAPTSFESIAISGSGVTRNGGTCATTLAPTRSCTVKLDWTPTQAGVLTDSEVSFTYPGGESSGDSQALTGTAVAKVVESVPAVTTQLPGRVISLKGSRSGRVTWLKPENDGGASISLYRISIRKAGVKKFGKWIDVTKLSYRFPKLKKGTYVVQVTAVNSQGAGAVATETFKAGS